MKTDTAASRVARCTERMQEQGIDVLLLTKPANMQYLTGDGRLCAFAMITRQGQVALGVPTTDVEDVSRLASYDQIVGFEDEVGMIHAIAHFFEHFGISSGVVGLEFTFVTQSMRAMLTHPHAKPAGVEVKDATPILSSVRMVKEPGEIEAIRRAGNVVAQGMQAAVKAVRPGVSETQIAAEAEHAMRYAGAEDFARSYVASGPRTNLAHGLPGDRALQSGDLVMIDLHPVVAGYSVDMCRTVCAGRPSEEQRRAYDLYRRAQEATIARARAGVGIGELESTMHGYLKEAGHGNHIFGPPLHGVGIEFEEAPLPAGHAFFHGEKEPPPLPENVVVSIGNCGLYLGPWGVRVEDTVAIGKDGPDLLTSFPKELTP